MDEVNWFIKSSILRSYDQQTKNCVDQLCADGTPIHEGYVDDPRNTDNAWLEAVVYHYHDDDGRLLGGVGFQVSSPRVPRQGHMLVDQTQSLRSLQCNRNNSETVQGRRRCEEQPG